MPWRVARATISSINSLLAPRSRISESNQPIFRLAHSRGSDCWLETGPAAMVTPGAV